MSLSVTPRWANCALVKVFIPTLCASRPENFHLSTGTLDPVAVHRVPSGRRGGQDAWVPVIRVGCNPSGSRDPERHSGTRADLMNPSGSDGGLASARASGPGRRCPGSSRRRSAAPPGAAHGARQVGLVVAVVVADGHGCHPATTQVGHGLAIQLRIDSDLLQAEGQVTAPGRVASCTARRPAIT